MSQGLDKRLPSDRVLVVAVVLIVLSLVPVMFHVTLAYDEPMAQYARWSFGLLFSALGVATTGFALALLGR